MGFDNFYVGGLVPPTHDPTYNVDEAINKACGGINFSVLRTKDGAGKYVCSPLFNKLGIDQIMIKYSDDEDLKLYVFVRAIDDKNLIPTITTSLEKLSLASPKK
jgi:hypothetical protein